MAMLAEPRQRKRYHLAPRGKPLYEDESRFGTKMLEKMGWKKGQGLGANEDGSKDFVRVRYKNDVLGLGFENRDDQWTEHEQIFNGLLKKLNNGETNPDPNIQKESGDGESENEIPARIGFGFQEKSKLKCEKMKEKISGVSLEERSKQSKARVHYKKFTKCKDLSQYSEKDLANIFGKKVVDAEVANGFYENLNNSFRGDENSNNVQTINTRLLEDSCVETKLECSQEQKNSSDINKVDFNLSSDKDILEKNASKKIKKQKIKNQHAEDNKEETHKDNTDKNNTQMIHSNVSINDYFKMKMETLKIKKDGLIPDENIVNNSISCDVVVKSVTKKKTKKEDLGNVCTPEQEKKSKKIKNNVEVDSENNETESEERVAKKERKAKKFEKIESIDLSPNETITKKNKDKSVNKTQVDTINENSKTKKRKYCDLLEESVLPSKDTDLVIDTPKEKKCKEKNHVIELNDNDKNKNPEVQKTKKKLKRTMEHTQASENDNVSFLKQDESDSTNSLKKPVKAKRKCVSFSETIFSSDDNKVLDIEDLKKNYKSYSIFQISSFCAEKFRNINLTHFEGSSLLQIEGYGISSDIQLDVKINKTDELRITNLWKGVLNKYIHVDKPKTTYQTYVREVCKAKKTKQKTPKLNVKTWKRKSAFQII